MQCVIQKFGGACFADIERLFAVARKLVSCGQQPVVAVVSAQQGVTDQLLHQMRAVGGTIESPAMDVLLATGELQSAALVAAALGHLGRRTEVVPPWSVFQTDAVLDAASVSASLCLTKTSLVLPPPCLQLRYQARRTNNSHNRHSKMCNQKINRA